MGGGSPFPQMGGRPENLPLNPNCSVIPNTKPLAHDPISSLAQMSQQLTSSGGGSMNGGAGQVPPGQGMMGGFVNNGMMSDMGPMGQMGQGGQMSMPGDGMGGPGMGGPGSGMDYGMGPGMGMGPGGQFGPMGVGGPGQRPMSPKIGPGMGPGFPGGPGMPPRMMGRGPMGPGPYNGTNIQVKPNAPNTIQYLPARPQVSNQNPRGPPSLDFLQRFAGPMNPMDDPMNKSNNQNNMAFFPNQPNNPGNMGGCGMDGDGSMGGGMGPMGGPMGPGPNTPPGMMNQGMMMRGMGRGPNMMRFPGPNNNPCMMGNQNFNSSNNNPNNMGGNDQMFPNSPNPQMFVAGPKGSPMGGLPMGQNGPNQIPTSNAMNGPPPPEMQQQMCGPGGPGPGPHFNKSHYMGPNTADPNYAQQYHNFQQQLYATNTRNQQGGPMGGMGGPNNQSFLMPK
jgi:hypothetical protein